MAHSGVIGKTQVVSEGSPPGVYWKFLDDRKISQVVRGLLVVALVNIVLGLYLALFMRRPKKQ